FTAKTARHDHHSSTRPEVRRPRIAEAPATPAQAPTALARCAAGKVEVIVESVAGITSAAPTPRRARIAISQEASALVIAAAEPTAEHARAAKRVFRPTEQTPKIARPASSVLRRPKRSPMAPAGRSRAAKTSE